MIVWLKHRTIFLGHPVLNSSVNVNIFWSFYFCVAWVESRIWILVLKYKLLVENLSFENCFILISFDLQFSLIHNSARNSLWTNIQMFECPLSLLSTQSQVVASEQSVELELNLQRLKSCIFQQKICISIRSHPTGW